jgi:LPXTG-motif cell wall-anchored protein
MRRLALLLLTLALAAAPAGALAQSAGDEQYADPLAEEAQAPTATPTEEEPLSSEPPANLGSGSGSGSGSGAPAATPTPTAATRSASGAAEAHDALPNTGSEPLVLAMLGAGLLCAGAGIRLRLQAD